MSIITAIAPDPKAVVVQRLRAHPLMVQFLQTRPPAARIKPLLPGKRLEDGADMPAHFVAVTSSGGFPPEGFVPHDFPRVDVFAYGPYGHEASTLLRVVHEILFPRSRRTAFTAAGGRVLDVIPDGGPREGLMPETGWPFRWRSYLLRLLEVPV